MNDYMIWIIAVFGLVSLIGVFIRMHGGFGPSNLRAVAIVLVTTLAALLAVNDTHSLTATMGILGAIAGYVFGIKDNPVRD
jgi:flagellar motor component MotA